MPHALPVRAVLACLLACALLLVHAAPPAGSHVTPPLLAGDDTKTGGGTG